MLRTLLELPEDSLQDSLAALDRAELLVRIDSELGDVLEFRHEMVRQVTYDSMVEKVREDIHARILARLENAGAGADEPDALCYHAVRARDWLKAFSHGRSAGRKCLSRSAFSDAASYFEIAMGALDKTPTTPSREADAIDLRMEARAAFIASGQVTEWVDLGKEAERRAGAIDDIGRKVAAMTVRAGAQNFSARLSKPSRFRRRSFASRNSGAMRVGSILRDTVSVRRIFSPAAIAKRD